MWAQKQELAIKCTLRPSLNMPRLLSRDLKTAPQAVHTRVAYMMIEKPFKLKPEYIRSYLSTSLPAF